LLVESGVVEREDFAVGLIPFGVGALALILSVGDFDFGGAQDRSRVSNVEQNLQNDVDFQQARSSYR
jgi:hypothetical protein